ncbi:hypothetical protein BJ875DRAFT_489646 [Amylocarpus encephaloides]|uniref:Uncharacterized protein n=1 Tax=Amylocarpus encephaloides TaxID=45428 RepID=A0A9P8C091_9HELO|nr:hypothetical protein BJ875DRAFT_489646 [Amylocarpus encephaloides]
MSLAATSTLRTLLMKATRTPPRFSSGNLGQQTLIPSKPIRTFHPACGFTTKSPLLNSAPKQDVPPRNPQFESVSIWRMYHNSPRPVKIVLLTAFTLLATAETVGWGYWGWGKYKAWRGDEDVEVGGAVEK